MKPWAMGLLDLPKGWIRRFNDRKQKNHQCKIHACNSLFQYNIYIYRYNVFQNKKIVKLYQQRPQIAKINFCVINVENSVTSARSSRQLFWTLFLDAIAVWAPCNGTSTPPQLGVTLPFPHHGTLQWHPAMAPSNGTTSTPLKLVVTLTPNHSTLLPSPHHSTLQWHTAMAPHPVQLVVTLPPNHSTLQWHPAMAPSNGTTSTPLKLVVTLTPNHSTLLPSPHHSKLQWHTAMAPSNGTTSTPVGRYPPPQP